jgi:hypothetical protein
LLGWLYKKKTQNSSELSPSSSVSLPGNGKYELEVVGESFYQDNLRAIAGPKSRDGKQHRCMAELVFESDNPADPNSIAVLIVGNKVGHLSRAQAVIYRAQFAKLGLTGKPALVAAMIVGGFINERNEGHFGVRLDITPNSE